MSAERAAAEPRRAIAELEQTLRERTAERDEALAQQAATTEILEIINRSSGDLAPVFKAMLDKTLRLCEASLGALCHYDGVMMRLAAASGASAEAVEAFRSVAPDPGSAVRQIVEGTGVVHVADIADDDVYRSGLESRRKFVDLTGARTALWLALRKGDALLGMLVIYRREVRLFSDKQVALLRNFADQAAIAIENARLMTETREALEKQTAMAEILRVISASPTDLQPTFDAIAVHAARLTGVAGSNVFRFDGSLIHPVAFHGMSDAEIEAVRTIFPRPPGRESVTTRAILAREVTHIVDPSNDPDFAHSDLTRYGTLLSVPMLRDGEPLGTITIGRRRVERFSDTQIDLLRTFADQAVIAIENARLMTETREALEKQTATAEILRVISASPTDLQPTLDAIAAHGKLLCDGASGQVFTYDGALIHHRAQYGASEAGLAAIRAVFPTAPGGGSSICRAILTREISHIVDPKQDPEFVHGGLAEYGTVLSVPMLRHGNALGGITVIRHRVEPFTPAQIDLLRTFADQAVIAIENVRLFSELRQRTSDLQESLEYQTATSDVLKVISRSTFDLQPVLDTLMLTAARLCDIDNGGLTVRDGDIFRYAAFHGLSDEFQAVLQRAPITPGRGSMAARTALEGKVVHVLDLAADSEYAIPESVTMAKIRTSLGVPLLREGRVAGTLVVNRTRLEPYTDRQIELLQSFADQAVIAIENARLLTELRESLEQQQAIAELLQVINSSPGKLTPVFDTVLEKAHTLCGASRGALFLLDGGAFRAASTRGYPDDLDARLRAGVTLDAGPLLAPLVHGARMVHFPDLLEVVRENDPIGRAVLERGGVRTNLRLPLRKDGKLLGFISCNRAEVRPFAEKEIVLLESFAAQAVIAMDNARLLEEIRRRQAELRVTFDNMGDAVIMFDNEQRLVAWNRNFLHMLDIPEQWLATPQTYGSFAQYLTERGEFGDTPPPDIGAPEQGEVRPIRYERARPDGRVLEVRRNPVPGHGGFVFIYSDITERKLAERSILAAREAAERALADLKLAQANLIQAEKMASLGQLTAGIAHEIKNPLNFVNNFASLSNELLGELKESAASALATLAKDERAEVDEIIEMLTGNLEKIQEHGRRADGIVKSMLAHSRGGSGERRAADINALVEESLNLAYHGARAHDQNFSITLERDYGKSIAPIELVPQDITRVFLNLCGNGFYAVNKRRRDGGEATFRPVLKVATRDRGDAVEVRIRDNGTGIPLEIKDKLFQPFFTTKPTGEGTGLGLSISYDIVTQQHGGTIEIDSRVGDFTEFTIHLPRNVGPGNGRVP